MRRPVKSLCLILNPVWLPGATTDTSFLHVLPQQSINNVSVTYTPPLFYFISLCQKIARHSPYCEPCGFLSVIYLGDHSHQYTEKHRIFFFNGCIASHCLFRCTVIYLPRLLTFGLFLVSSYWGRERKMLT